MAEVISISNAVLADEEGAALVEALKAKIAAIKTGKQSIVQQQLDEREQQKAEKEKQKLRQRRAKGIHAIIDQTIENHFERVEGASMPFVDFEMAMIAPYGWGPRPACCNSLPGIKLSLEEIDCPVVIENSVLTIQNLKPKT